MSGRAYPLFGGGHLLGICSCRSRVLTVILLSMFLLTIPFHSSNTSHFLVYDDIKDSKTFHHSIVPHNPIRISSDAEFEKMGFEGNGTETNPYIIEDLSIENDAFDGKCISIVSTSAYFIIQNCVLFSDNERSGFGVYLEKVSNGVVTDCEIHTLETGIYVLKSEECRFESNTLSRLEKGFYLTQSLHLELLSNSVSKSDNGLSLYKIDYSEVTSNRIVGCDYGIYTNIGVGIQVQSNQVIGSFFGIYFYNTIDCQSLLNSVTESQYGIYYFKSQDCNISSSDLSKNRYGVFLIEVDRGIVSDSVIKSNFDYGIYIKDSRRIDILSNAILENSGSGLHLLGVTNAAIHDNELGFNFGGNAADSIGKSTSGLLNEWNTNAWSDYKGTNTYRIFGDRGSVDNDPHYIILLDSPVDIDLEAPGIGEINWSAYAFKPGLYLIVMNDELIDEGVWDGRYIPVSFSDLNPGIYRFMLSVTTTSGITLSDEVRVSVIDSTPPVWDSLPENQIIECGSPLRYQLLASDYYGISHWWVNDTNFTIEFGLLKNTSVLNYGVYHLEVRAYDPSDNFVSQSFDILVSDTTAPVIDSSDDVTYIEGEIGNSIHWAVSDYNPSSYEILKDGATIESGEWTADMKLIQYSVDGLNPGTYIFSLVLTDIVGNTASDDIQVIVEEISVTETPTTSTGTTDTETSSTPVTEPSTIQPTPTGIMSLMTLGLIGVGAGVAVVILLIVLKKR